MSIEFGCFDCGKLLRVPESSARKKARCPACGSIQEVPDVTGIDPPLTSPDLSQETQALQPARESPTRSPSSTGNPFGDRAEPTTGNPFASDSMNPYAAPASGAGMVSQRLVRPGSRVWARTCVEGPANSLAAVGGIVLIFTGIAFIINLFEFFEGGANPQFAMTLIGTLTTAVPYGIVVYGANQMKQLKSYKLAVVASILGMLPCSGCCILGLPVGIWSLVVLCNSDIRSAFR